VRYLLDTPLLIELVNSAADSWISRWFEALNEEDLCISAVTIGELTRGIASQEDGPRKVAMQDWFEQEFLLRFHGKIIPLDLEIMKEWGTLTARCELAEKPLSSLDALIAATVKTRNLVLITFNREQFSAAGIEVSDPWRG
jgi:predicted nucleic acid-binding protein